MTLPKQINNTVSNNHSSKQRYEKRFHLAADSCVEKTISQLQGVQILLVGNKSDLEALEVEQQEAEDLAKELEVRQPKRLWDGFALLAFATSFEKFLWPYQARQ